MELDDQRHAPAALPPGKTLDINFIGDRVGLWSGLEGWGKSRSHRDTIPGPSSQ